MLNLIVEFGGVKFRRPVDPTGRLSSCASKPVQPAARSVVVADGAMFEAEAFAGC